MFLSLRLAIKGYKMPLEVKDLWSLNQRDSSKVMVPKLLKEWEKEQSKDKRYVCERGGRRDEWEMERRKTSLPYLKFEEEKYMYTVKLESHEFIGFTQ